MTLNLPNLQISIKSMCFNCLFKTISLNRISVFSLIGLICLFCGNSFAAQSDAAAIKLRDKYTELTKQLNNNQYQRQLYLNSEESPNDLKGEIYAVVDYPFIKVNEALNNPDNWCDALILHVNIKYCHASTTKSGSVLTVDIGNKLGQSLADAYRVNFNYREMATTPEYFAVQLSAQSGPLGTSNYRIWVEATPLNDGHTFLHFTYAYSFGLSGRLAMKTYLATVGRNKVGFTINGKLDDGQPAYIKGVRGVVERNTMRYYLAIDTYIAEMSSARQDQLELRLQRWYSATELYARQLHELERIDYLKMKRLEYQRQQTAQ